MAYHRHSGKGMGYVIQTSDHHETMPYPLRGSY